MSELKKYDLTITKASLRIKDWGKVVRSELNSEEIDIIHEIGGGKSSTAKTLYNAFLKRNRFLSEDQKELFINTTYENQKKIALLGMCKTHHLIGDFIIEVLREKVLLFDYELKVTDYITFYRRKVDSHEELEKITESTRNKIQQVIFRVLEESGLIDNVKTKIIQPQILAPEVIEVIKKDNKEWLKLFFWSDYEIENR